MATTRIDLRRELARTDVASLTLQARQLAAGWASGTHRADRKGSGVEFAGHRAYVPGDDLRYLDRHALLRHQRLLVREYLTDTERAVHLVIDVTESMKYRGQSPKPDQPSKAERALLLGAASAMVAQQAGDDVGLTTVTANGATTWKPRGGRDAFERIVHSCETLFNDQSSVETNGSLAPLDWKSVFSFLGSSLPRGTLVLVLSDFLDIDGIRRTLTALGTRRRAVRALQILTPEEVEFPFEGSLRLQDLETEREVETDAASVRRQYQQALNQLTNELRTALSHQGGSLHRTITIDPPEDALRYLASGDTISGRLA